MGLFYLATTILVVFPLWQLCPRYRMPSWFALFAIVPLGLIVILWLFAYRDQVKIPGVDT